MLLVMGWKWRYNDNDDGDGDGEWVATDGEVVVSIIVGYGASKFTHNHFRNFKIFIGRLASLVREKTDGDDEDKDNSKTLTWPTQSVRN